ncbi:hypothetical protein ACJMK2_012259 [Sinanodonta woodiana]|uniref:CUB domain-containing protein n=1 Tax=Sinanodonta woodiana TaxID=1069815 RepID=A0ABD3V7J4_SINWO
MATFHIGTVLQWLFLLTVLNWRDVHAINTYYMDDNCNETIALSDEAMKLILTSEYRYPSKWDCKMTIKARTSDTLMYFFKHFDVSYGCKDWLEVYDDAYGSSRIFCGWQETGRVYVSSLNSLKLRFHSNGYKQDDGYTMIITPFHLGDCDADEYKCHNSRCIDESNFCNGYNPCGDYSDCALGGGAIAGIVIATVAVVTAIIVTVICCVRKRRLAIKRQNVQVPVPTSYPTGQNVIQTHAAYSGVYMSFPGAEVDNPGYSNQIYSEAMSTHPPTMLPSNPPVYYEHTFSK